MATLCIGFPDNGVSESSDRYVEGVKCGCRSHTCEGRCSLTSSNGCMTIFSMTILNWFRGEGASPCRDHVPYPDPVTNPNPDPNRRAFDPDAVPQARGPLTH